MPDKAPWGPKASNLARRPSNQSSSPGNGQNNTKPLASSSTGNNRSNNQTSASAATGNSDQASASTAAGGTATQTSTTSITSNSTANPTSSTSRPLEQWRDGLRPPQDVSIGEDINLMTNTAWITKTPLKIYEYETEYSSTLPTQSPNGNRQARSVVRREEKVMIVRALQQRLLASQSANQRVSFAFSHQCDCIWSVEHMPGGFISNVEHYDTIAYSRKDGVAETLDRLTLRPIQTDSFTTSISIQDVHGTVAQHLNGGPLLALLNAFASQHALMDANTVKMGGSRYFQPANPHFTSPLPVASMRIAQGFLFNNTSSQAWTGHHH